MVTDADTGNLCLTLGFYRLVQSTLGTFSSSSFSPPRLMILLILQVNCVKEPGPWTVSGVGMICCVFTALS